MPENMIMQSILNLISKLKKIYLNQLIKMNKTQKYFSHIVLIQIANLKPTTVQVYFSLGYLAFV